MFLLIGSLIRIIAPRFPDRIRTVREVIRIRLSRICVFLIVPVGYDFPCILARGNSLDIITKHLILRLQLLPVNPLFNRLSFKQPACAGSHYEVIIGEEIVCRFQFRQVYIKCVLSDYDIVIRYVSDSKDYIV